jgi:hypothetical protein
MDPKTPVDGRAGRRRSRVLVVADWAVDAQAVVSACASAAGRDLELGLLVPAWLHGLDWIGDPHASTPCARRQLADIRALAHEQGVDFNSAGVGDPDVLTGICDALAAWPADELVLCSRPRRLHLPHPFGLARRARRLTGLTVGQMEVASTEGATWRVPLTRWRTGHCAPKGARAALA